MSRVDARKADQLLHWLEEDEEEKPVYIHVTNPPKGANPPKEEPQKLQDSPPVVKQLERVHISPTLEVVKCMLEESEMRQAS